MDTYFFESQYGILASENGDIKNTHVSLHDIYAMLSTLMYGLTIPETTQRQPE